MTRIGSVAVRQLGVDETVVPGGQPAHSTVYVDRPGRPRRPGRDRHGPGQPAADLRRWTASADPGGWRASRSSPPTWPSPTVPGSSPHLDHARRVADPFHVVRVANRCLDKIRRQRAERDPRSSGPQGRSAVSDPQAHAHRRRTPRRPRPRTAAARASASVTPTTRSSAPGWPKNPSATSTSPTIPPTPGCCSTRPSPAAPTDDVPEIASLGNTLAEWRPEILAHHVTGASNGPTEGLNLCVKKVKRCGHGFRSFEPLPPPRPPPRRRRHLAPTAITTPHQHPRPPLQRVEPVDVAD